MANFDNSLYTYTGVINQGQGYFKRDDAGRYSHGVLVLQKKLKIAKYFSTTSEPDGIFDAYTEKQVQLFQKDNCGVYGLTVDGIAGQKTLIRLREVLADAVMGGDGYKGTYSYDDYLTYEKRKANAEYIRHYLVAKGWSLEAVCAVLGNMDKESTICPGKWQNGAAIPGYGLVQWTPATKYTKWADERGYDHGNIKAQLKRIQYELENNQQWQIKDFDMSFQEFTTSHKSAYYLAKVWRSNYEIGGVGTATERSQLARGWYKRLSRMADPF